MFAVSGRVSQLPGQTAGGDNGGNFTIAMVFMILAMFMYVVNPSTWRQFTTTSNKPTSRRDNNQDGSPPPPQPPPAINWARWAEPEDATEGVDVVLEHVSFQQFAFLVTQTQIHICIDLSISTYMCTFTRIYIGINYQEYIYIYIYIESRKEQTIN